MNATVTAYTLAAVGTLTVGTACSWAIARGPVATWLVVAAAVAGALAAGAAVFAVASRRERRLRRALRRHDEQLAQTAHELRTPLTAIASSLEIVRAGFADDPEECEAFLAEADLAARHLGFLIHDILDHAALSSGHLRLEVGTHDVAQLIRDGLRVLGMQAARHAIRVRVDEQAPALSVHGDARRAQQVLVNLVGNAIKFSPEGAPIDVGVLDDGDRVRFVVCDAGPGVADTVVPELFRPFAGDDGQQRADSTGLGLYISRQLVERMGGAIGYRPRPDGGSEFWFTLPKGRPSLPPTPQHEAAPRGGRTVARSTTPA